MRVTLWYFPRFLGHTSYEVKIRDVKGGKQMRSISVMLSDELAGDALRRVPLPYKRRKCHEFLQVQ